MKIIVVGAGPAGMICAGVCAQNKTNEVMLVDANEKLGKKLFITGKGRCNICNNCTTGEFFKNVVTNAKFLFSAINKFPPEEVISFFESLNLQLKTERGGRVFPVSDKSSDIIKAFSKFLKENNVELSLNTKVYAINKADDKFFLTSSKGHLECDVLIVATGGKSYSSTGSCGDGYKFAKQLEHSVVAPKPALVPMVLKDYDGALAGLSLKNVCCTIKCGGKDFKEFGEMLFTHNGVSGPIVLTLSSFVNKYDLKDCSLTIDLKPALSYEQLEERLLRDFAEFKNKSLKNYFSNLLPSSLIEYFLKAGNFDGKITASNISKEIRQKIISLLKELSFKIARLEDIECAIITSGGVDTKQINPQNMQSKLVKNLFFIGEVLDIDALTGGFNLQIALSTGYSAGAYLRDGH